MSLLKIDVMWFSYSASKHIGNVRYRITVNKVLFDTSNLYRSLIDNCVRDLRSELIVAPSMITSGTVTITGSSFDRVNSDRIRMSGITTFQSSFASTYWTLPECKSRGMKVLQRYRLQFKDNSIRAVLGLQPYRNI